MNRTEIHAHTVYSNIRLLDCINSPVKLIDRAISLGLKGIAITDHESLSAHVEVNQYQQKVKDDIKIILGNEIYLTDTRESGIKYYHCILLAKDAIGQRQLRILSTYSWLNSYTDRGMERVPTLKSELKDVIALNPGHIICTSACLGGELSSLAWELAEARKIGNSAEERKIYNKILNFIREMKDIFGDDFYVEIAPANSLQQNVVNKLLVNMASAMNLKIVIGCDAHYLSKEDRFIHKAYLNSQGGEREVDQFYEFSYLQSEEEIIENLRGSFDNAEEIYRICCSNSMEIYDKCEIYDLSHSQQIPKVEVKDYRKGNRNGEDKYPILKDMLWSEDKVERYWVNECINKLEELDKINDTYLSRLEEEARIKKVIGEKLKTNMYAYPVTLQHYVDLFWECGSTVGAGRGSSCSGLNHYLLGITQLDPIEYKLPFWRYLNDERTELGSL